MGQGVWGLGCVVVLAACATWPHAARVPLTASGLIGEWAGQPAWSRGDTIVWHFEAGGSAYRVRIHSVRREGAPPSSVDREPFGDWWVYRDSTARAKRFVCLEYGRERARPSCWYFAIDSVTDEAGRRHRELQWLGRVGGPARAPEVYVERPVPTPDGT